jgi:hypothetical protein
LRYQLRLVERVMSGLDTRQAVILAFCLGVLFAACLLMLGDLIEAVTAPRYFDNVIPFKAKS